MDLREWFNEFHAALREFAATRGAVSPVVRIIFLDNTNVYAQGLRPGPGDGYVTIQAYPENPMEDMVATTKGPPLTPTVILAPFPSIKRVEFLVDVPEHGEFGFGRAG